MGLGKMMMMKKKKTTTTTLRTWYRGPTHPPAHRLFAQTNQKSLKEVKRVLEGNVAYTL